MAKPNFFCGIEALQALLKMKLDGFEPETELTVDLIELPYLFVYTAAEDAWTMKVYSRGELYDHKQGSGIEKGTLRMDRKTGQGSGQCSDKVLADNMGAFFHGCQQLSRYIQKEKLQPLYKGLDPEQAGILLEAAGGALKARKVAGMDRPEMVCTTLFGGMTKCRPYMEDFLDRSETDMMSLEEKIEKAEGGDKFAMAQLAQAYLDGDGEVEQDPKQAAYWFRKEAELQDAEGAFNLGLLYAKGFGVERDFVQAAEWMEKAVAWGDGDGAAPAKQYRTMAENLKKAQAGDAAAMAEVAGTYMAMGGSLAQAGAGDDYAESLKWAQKAVDAGCPAGYWPLALAYEHGRGVQQDKRKAVELYRKGAELGHAACQHSYGCCLMTGQGAKKDVKQALALFERSAAQGYGLAYQALGHMYETGEGVEPDFDKEMEYYEKACAALPDNAEFLRHVGYQYVNLMDGDEASWLRAVERAAYWLRKAAELGDGTARSGVDMFDRILELHRQGKIPAGSSLDQCMAYLSGKAPAKANDSKGKAKHPAKAPAKGAKAPAGKAKPADEPARRKAEGEAAERRKAAQVAEQRKREQKEKELSRQKEQQQQQKSGIALAKEAVEREEKAFRDLDASCKRTIQNNGEKIEKLTSQKKGLGLFAFKEKGALQKRINELREENAALKAKIEAAQKKRDQACEGINKKLVLLEAKPGTSVVMGKDPNPGGRPIRWFIACKERNKLHLVAEHSMAYQSYPAAESWLSEFPETAFDGEERAILARENGSLACIPQEKDVLGCKQGYGATPSDALVAVIRQGVESMSYYSRLQRENLLKNRLEDLQKYWLRSDYERGWATIASKNGTGSIGASASYGVRPMIVIDLDALSRSL